MSMRKITAKFRAFLKRIGKPESDIDARLAGIHELRECVAWANSVNEYTHDYMTPDEILARFRKEGA